MGIPQYQSPNKNTRKKNQKLCDEKMVEMILEKNPNAREENFGGLTSRNAFGELIINSYKNHKNEMR